MNIERFKMPVIIAASLHGALFLVMPQTSVGTGKAVDAPKDWQPPAQEPIPVDLTPPEEGESNHSAGGGKSLPSLPDLPQPLREPATITVPITHRSPTMDPVKDLGEYRGEPPGAGIGPGDLANLGIPGITHLDRIPRAMVQPAPAYPDELRRQGMNGSVTVKFIVDTEGRVVKADVVSSTHRGFEEPALRAVLRWKFEPGTQNGRKVSFRMAVPIEFAADR